MFTFFAVLLMLGILSALIIVHECGHYLVARFFGFQTPVFGIGLPFGPFITVGKKFNTEFRIYACLLGGFVAIPELGDESSMQHDAFGIELQPFRKFPIWQRALVAVAGVTFNVIFAYLIMVTMFTTLGQPTQPTVVHSLIKSNPIAENAGIKKDDIITGIDNQKVETPDDAVHYLVSHKAAQVIVHIVRESKPVDINLTTNEQGKVGMALISKGEVTYRKIDKSFPEICIYAGQKTWSLTASMVDALGQMVTTIASGGGGGGEKTGKPSFSIQDLHGVLAVIKIGADIAEQDWSQLFMFTIMISLDLAIINMVPWPALDGGHLAFMAYEAIFKKPMSERFQSEIVKWGFVSLLVLMAVIMVNDVTALLNGKLNMNFKKSGNSAEKSSSDSTESKTATPKGQEVTPLTLPNN